MSESAPPDPTRLVTNPVWDMFAPSEVDRSTVAYDYVEYKNDTVQVASGGTQSIYNYVMRSKDLDSYLLPNKSYIAVRFSIRADNAGTNLDIAEASTLVNGGMNLFKDAEFHMNGNLVERVDEPGIVQVVDCLKEMSKDAAESISQTEWFYPEHLNRLHGTAADPTNTPYVVETGPGGSAQPQKYLAANDLKTFSESFAVRNSRTSESRIVELQIPLSRIFGFCRDVPYVFRGAQFMLRLNKNTEYGRIIQSFFTAPAANAQTVIESISLWMPRLVPSLSVSSVIENQLVSKNMTKYIFENATCFTSDQQSANSGTWKITTTTHRPTLAIIGIQDERKYSNKIDAANPVTTRLGVANGSIFSFLNNITRIELRVNSKIVPVEPYQLTFADPAAGAGSEYARAYLDFLRSGGKGFGDNDGLVSYEEYKELYPLFAFDMSHADTIYDKVKQNDIEVRYTVERTNPVAVNFKIYAVLYAEQEMENKAVDGRNVIRV